MGRTLLHETLLEGVLLEEDLAGRRIPLGKTSRPQEGLPPAGHTHREQIPGLLKAIPFFLPTIYKPWGSRLSEER